MQWINGMKQSSEIDSMYNFVYGKDVIKNQNNIRSVWSNLHKWKTFTMTLKYWKNISWIRKLHTTEMSIVPKLVYRLETISLQFWGTKLGSAGLHTVKPYRCIALSKTSQQVCKSSHLAHVSHHPNLNPITFTVYDINDHVLWHHKHSIHDIRSPLYDITSIL